MTFISNRRIVATIVAASCIAVPALASGRIADAAQSGGNAANRAGAKFAYPPNGFDGGDIAESHRTAKSTYPPSGFNGGDNPADLPGASRTPTAAPTTIEVVRPSARSCATSTRRFR